MKQQGGPDSLDELGFLSATTNVPRELYLHARTRTTTVTNISRLCRLKPMTVDLDPEAGVTE